MAGKSPQENQVKLEYGTASFYDEFLKGFEQERPIRVRVAEKHHENMVGFLRFFCSMAASIPEDKAPDEFRLDVSVGH